MQASEKTFIKSDHNRRCKSPVSREHSLEYRGGEVEAEDGGKGMVKEILRAFWMEPRWRRLEP